MKDARSEAERTFRFWATMVFGLTMMLGGCVVAINTGEERELTDDERVALEKEIETLEKELEAVEISGEAA